jgi:hypothetical protein
LAKSGQLLHIYSWAMAGGRVLGSGSATAAPWWRLDTFHRRMT